VGVPGDFKYTQHCRGAPLCQVREPEQRCGLSKTIGSGSSVDLVILPAYVGLFGNLLAADVLLVGSEGAQSSEAGGCHHLCITLATHSVVAIDI